MKRSLPFILLILITLTTYSLVAAAQEAVNVPVGNMVIKAPSHLEIKKNPVFFTHSSHLKFSCKACHHTWENQGAVTGCTASGCHEKLMPAPPAGEPSQNKNVRSITGAYHGACLGCHRDQRKQAAAIKDTATFDAIPVKCDGCHNDNYKGQDYSKTHFRLPLGNLKIEPPEDIYAKRAAVNFPHDLHFEHNCSVCHHDWIGFDEEQNCMTSGCHDQFEPDENTRNINAPENSLYFLAAYHNVCYKCHKELSDSEAAPPTKCDGCHNDG